MIKRSVPIKESGYYLSAWGNENIIKNHIAYFEKKLVEEVTALKNMEIEISSAHYPNFAAWIRFYSELICNSLYWKLFRYEGNWENIQKLSFGEARDMMIERIEKETALLAAHIEKNDLMSMTEAINLVLNLRHSFQRGGLPNLMRSLWYKSSEEKFIRMLSPRNYKETKEIFAKAEKLIKLLPQPTIAISER